MDKHPGKRRKFAHEILILAGFCALCALVLFLLLTNIATTVAEVYCFENDVPMTEFDWMKVDRWIFSLGSLFSVALFCVLFLSKLGERLRYIRVITRGIDAMRSGEPGAPIPLEGNNELTELAQAIHYMNEARQELLEKERALAREKDRLIHSLSHDIRTPLTSILSYSEYLAEENTLSPEERQTYLGLIRRKAQQIRDLTDILLDGANRNPEHFPDGRLLLTQLAAEFEQDLEDSFAVQTDFSHCPPFAGDFDVGELRRIFDNLSSNVQKYADPAAPVSLTVTVRDGTLVLCQGNAVLAAAAPAESRNLGIPGIRRIAQYYGGSVETMVENDLFSITIRLNL